MHNKKYKQLIFPSMVMLIGIGVIFKIIHLLYWGLSNGEIIDRRGIIHYSGTPKYYIGIMALLAGILLLILGMKKYWKYTKTKIASN